MKKLLNNVVNFCKNNNLIEQNDKIAVGLSGGKDSLTLLTILSQMHNLKIFNFELIAISIDLFNGQTDYSKIQEYCDKLSVELVIVPSNIYEILFEIRKESNPCALCSKLRKGYLLSKAKELGCNKVALGHHADDLIQTFFMSLMFEGRISTFQPSNYLDRTQITQIRPLLTVWENETTEFAKDLPILKNLCPADKHTKRETIKEAIQFLETFNKDLKKSTLKALLEPKRWQNQMKLN